MVIPSSWGVSSMGNILLGIEVSEAVVRGVRGQGSGVRSQASGAYTLSLTCIYLLVLY